MDRRLAAIMATDVVGYSRLMDADEEGILVRLKAHRDEITNPAIANHKGRSTHSQRLGVRSVFRR
jgi:adenylate cyclase